MKNVLWMQFALAAGVMAGCSSDNGTSDAAGGGDSASASFDASTSSGDGAQTMTTDAASTDLSTLSSTDQAMVATQDLAQPPGPAIKTVFLIMMENHNWSDIKGSSSAPYINNTLLPMASHAEQYFNPPGIHPSEPNYLWLEAGTNFGVTNDNPPSSNHQSSTMHLATLLKNANIPWKAYQEDISGTKCPLSSTGNYAPKHDPFVFFDDLTGTLSSSDSYCIAHNRPMTELATDLSSNNVARYNFLTPNLCNDMHNSCAPQNDPIQQGDDWLKMFVPMIMNSSAYKNGGAIFITWDESELGDFPIGMIVVSSAAKGNGYSNTIKYTHSSMLRSAEEIFGVSPFLGDAANSNDLADLFTTFP